MRIGVEQAVDEHHLHVQLDERRHHARHVHSRDIEPVDARPLHELHHEHALAREFVHDLRNDQVAVPREVRADLHRVLGFEAEVHLLRDAQLELVEHHAHAQHVRMLPVTLHPREDPPRRNQVRLHGRLDAGPQHFHRDDLSLVARAMHLAERSGGHRHALERLEHFVHPRGAHPLRVRPVAVIALGHDPRDRVETERRDLVDELPEFREIRFRNEVGPRGEHLRHLHERGPKADDRLHESACAARVDLRRARHRPAPPNPPPAVPQERDRVRPEREKHANRVHI